MKTTFIIGFIILLTSIVLPTSDWLVERFEAVETNQPLLTCANPTILNVESCREMEEQILNSTVRILVESWQVADNEQGYIIEHSAGHATVMDGRYLVTHDHFSIPLSIQQPEDERYAYSVVFLYDTKGNLLQKAPLSDFEIINEANEVMILAHTEANFFDELGVESAKFLDWRAVTLEAGMEVAQIDWDGQISRVDWTKVKEVRINEETPILILEDGAIPGASGGGIFWNGYHIANNWRINEQIDAAGEIIDTVTKVALNTFPTVR